MNGPWHYGQAEQLLRRLNDENLDDADAYLLAVRAQAHATLAAAAASTVHAFFDDDVPELWAQAFNDGHPLDAVIVETPEQWAREAAIVDANLDRVGVTLGGEAKIVEAEPGPMFQAYQRNRAEGRDQVESAARAIVELT